MAWKQIINFDLGKMGTTPGLCLQNVRLGYGIAPKYASARDAMNASKREGTFHEGLDIPTDVAVPIFAETGSPYAHVMVDCYGDVYSDGKHLSTLKGMTVLGWSETLNDARVVEWVADPVPAPTPEPTPEPEPQPAPVDEGFKVGDVVVPTRLVDYNGTPLKQYDDTYTITQINGDRAVLSAPRNGKMVVWAALNTKDIRKA